MKKTIGIVKLVLVIILLAFILIVGYQNWEYFADTQSLQFDLIFNKLCYVTPDIPNIIYFLSCFIIGFLVAYFLSLLDQFKANSTMKRLNDSIASYQKQLSGLEKEVETLKADSQKNSPVAAPSSEQPEPVVEETAESSGSGENGSGQAPSTDEK